MKRISKAGSFFMMKLINQTYKSLTINIPFCIIIYEKCKVKQILWEESLSWI